MKLVARHDLQRQARLPIVLLSGALRPSPLRQRLDIPVLCLPLTPTRTLLDFWLSAIACTPGEKALTIVVSSAADADRLRSDLESRRTERSERFTHHDFDVEVIVDPAPWRGAGGLIYDIVSRARGSDANGGGRLNGLPNDSGDHCRGVLVAEAACVPPESLEPMTRSLTCNGSTTTCAGVSGVSATAEPAGLYAFNDDAIRLIPPIGYFDLKEQLLPELYARGRPIPVVQVTDRTLRLWDRESYLNAVNAVGGADDRWPMVRIGRGAHVVQPCLIGREVTIGPGAIIHASVLMEGAVIGAGATVSRSVIGPGCVVPEGVVVRSDMIAEHSPSWTKLRHPQRRVRSRRWFSGGSESR